MAVQAKTSLQSQGVPRAETSHLHCWILQQCFSYIDHVLPQSRNLKPVFSSVPRSSDRVINSCKLGLELRHKWHFAEGHSTDQRLQGLCALRTLQRNQPVFLKVMNFCVEVLLRDDFLDMLDHNVLIRPIDHDPNGLLRFQVGRNSVINDSSPLIKEHRKVTLRHTRLALPAGISHSRPLQQFHAIRPSKHQLTHMADIKDRGTASAMQMLLDDSLRVVDRQVVTCKLNDFSLLGDMQLLEAGVLAC